MPKIGLLSDTHSFLDDRIFDYFKDCDEIWHAGDFGNIDVSDRLEAFKPLRGVYGNIDGGILRKAHKEVAVFECGGLNVLMIHIGGKPGKYPSNVKSLIHTHQPDIFVCGHSHILRVATDKAYNNMLFLNPGAAGREGFHKTRTILRFEIDNGKVKNMQAIELGTRGA